MLEHSQIDDYYNIYEDNPKYYQYWISIFSIVIVTIVMFLNFMEYDFFHSVKLYYIEDSFHVRVLESDMNKIINHKTLQIGNINYSYTVNEVSEPIFNYDNYVLYYDIIISVDLDKKFKINNNIIEGKIMLNSKKGFEIMKSFIFGKDS